MHVVNSHVLLVLTMCVSLCSGCGDPGTLLNQKILLGITDAVTGQPAPKVAVVAGPEFNRTSNETVEAFLNSIPIDSPGRGTTDENGRVIVAFGGGVLCVREECFRDRVTGEVFHIGVETSGGFEVLTVAMTPGNSVSGEQVVVTVVKIGGVGEVLEVGD